jgi:hypothetical protein
MPLRKRFFIIAFVTLPLTLASRVAPAQNQRCSAVTKGHDYLLDSVAEVFESAGWSEARKDVKIEQQPATAVGSVMM